MPRVCVIGPCSEKHKGGVAQFTSRLCDEIDKSDQLLFISWYKQYPFIGKWRDLQAENGATRIGDARAQFTLGYLNPLSWLRTARLIRKWQPDFLVLTWVHPIHAPIYLALYLLLYRSFKGEQILLCHNVLPHEPFPFSRLLTRLALFLRGRVVVHSESEAKKIQELRPGTVVSKLFLPQFDFFQAESSGTKNEVAYGATRLLFFGHIRHYKGVDILLEAVASLVGRGIALHLTIAGEVFGGDASNLQKIVAQLNLEETVTFNLRYIPDHKVRSLFANADIAVFPYRSASQSGSLMVAYAFGVPVIATKVGGLVEAVEDGVSGYLCEANAESLADAIERSINQPVHSESVKEFASRFTWESYVRKVFLPESN